MVVIWTEKATTQLRSIYEYLLEVAGRKIAKHIIDRIENTVEKLAKYPKMGIIEEELAQYTEEYRSFVVHKNYKIIYHIVEKNIYISTLFDCRQNPKKMLETKG